MMFDPGAKRSNFEDSFEKPDTKTFRNLAIAFEAMRIGGNMPCIINAANEVVVESFLKDKIGFLEMSDVIEGCMQKASFVKTPTIDDYVASDKEVRALAYEMIK